MSEKAQKLHGLVFEVAPTILRFRAWLENYLLWNFIIRLFIEMSMLLAFCCLLTMKYAELIGFMGWLNVISAWLFMGAVVVMPFFVLFFYLKNFERMNSEDEEIVEEFEDKFGAPMEGLKKELKASIFYSIWFIVRRVLFVLIVLYLYKRVLLQLGLQLFLSLVSYVYLVQWRPFDDGLI